MPNSEYVTLLQSLPALPKFKGFDSIEFGNDFVHNVHRLLSIFADTVLEFAIRQPGSRIIPDHGRKVIMLQAAAAEDVVNAADRVAAADKSSQVERDSQIAAALHEKDARKRAAADEAAANVLAVAENSATNEAAAAVAKGGQVEHDRQVAVALREKETRKSSRTATVDKAAAKKAGAAKKREEVEAAAAKVAADASPLSRTATRSAAAKAAATKAAKVAADKAAAKKVCFSGCPSASLTHASCASHTCPPLPRMTARHCFARLPATTGICTPGRLPSCVPTPAFTAAFLVRLMIVNLRIGAASTITKPTTSHYTSGMFTCPWLPPCCRAATRVPPRSGRG